MKKTVIALVCALVSSGALAASITHGQNLTMTTGSGTYYSNDTYTSITNTGGTKWDADGGKIVVDNHSTILKKQDYRSGETSNSGVGYSDWVSAGGLTWGDSLSGSVTVDKVTGCGNHAGIVCVGGGAAITDSQTLGHKVTTTHPNGMVSVENISEDRSYRRDDFNLTTTSYTVTSGIFME